MKKFTKALFRTLAVAAFWLLLWLAAAKCVGKELLLPMPQNVLRRLFEIMSEKSFYVTTAYSLVRVLLGIVLATLIGILLAVLTHFSRVALAVIKPIITVVKATPVASFIILALVWLDRAKLPVFISLLMVLPIIWTNLTAGFSAVDTKLVEMAHVFSVGRRRIARDIYIPSLMPYFSSAVRTSLGLAWKAGIAAEVLAVPAKSIGKKLFESKAYLETTDLFAWTAVVIILSLIIEFVFETLMSRVFRTERREKKKKKDVNT